MAASCDKQTKKTRSNAGAVDAKKAATMTKEEWTKLQNGMKEKWPQPAYMQNRPIDRPHTCYMDETFELVTRWMANTRIQYRPHAKSPGSKSHIRYESYSKAKTVGEALELGTFPVDWCWDYERGFIKVLGPVRDEPIDPVNVADEKMLTDVDKAIYGWYIKELAKKLNFSVKELIVNKSNGESAVMRLHRLNAQRFAKAALKAAKSEGRRITDDEITQCMDAWGYLRNPNRGNVNPEGRDWVWSDNIGLTRDRLGSIHPTKATTKYPEFTELIVKWLMDRLPEECNDFKFTSLNLNKNYGARMHRDGNNFGPSMIAAFGKFSGGELNYWSEDNKSCKLEELPAKPTQKFQLGDGLALFNGNSAHSVNSFEGQRFSVVYFTAGCHASAEAEDVSILKQLGMPYPLQNLEEFALLRRPRGYLVQGSPVVETIKCSKQSTSRYWTRKDLEKQTFKQKQWNTNALQKWEEHCTQLSQKSFVLRRPNMAGGGKENKGENLLTPGHKRDRSECLESAAKRQRTSSTVINVL